MFHGTTILCVRRGKQVVMGGDGQVSIGSTVMKSNAVKVRLLSRGVLLGFAGGTADALTMFERFEEKHEQYQANLMRASVELAKEWRTDKALRPLEALLVVADANQSFTISGHGDVIEPEQGIMAIGSGGDYAKAAALALLKHSRLPAEQIVKHSLSVAASICVYTNHCTVIESIASH